MNKIILNKQKNILLIEDYNTIADIMIDYLSELKDIEVTNVKRIDKAIEEVNKKGYSYYDAYILDYHLDDSVGTIFLKKLAHKISGIVITFSSTEEFNEEMIEDGADFKGNKNDPEKVIYLIKEIFGGE